MSLLTDPFSAGFMQRALLELMLLGVIGAVVGVHILLRRLAFVTEAIQHTVFPGIAIAFVAGQSLLVGALAAAVLSIVLLGRLTRGRRIGPDAALAVLISGFFALGVVIVSRGGSFQHDLTALLFGRILTVDTRQVVETAVIAALALIVVIALHKELILRAFDPMGSEALGVPVARLDLILNLVIALAVVASVRAVGTVLVVAFLVTPAAAARLCCRRVPSMMAVAMTLTTISGIIGLAVSYEASVSHGVRIAPGAAVVVAITTAFAAVATTRYLLNRRSPAEVTAPVGATAP